MSGLLYTAGCEEHTLSGGSPGVPGNTDSDTRGTAIGSMTPVTSIHAVSPTCGKVGEPEVERKQEQD